MLRLGEHLLEVPISAMLVLGVSSAGAAATSRVAETLVGAGVGVLATVLFPPPVQTRTAGEAVEVVASADRRRPGPGGRRAADAGSGDRAGAWLEDVRRLNRYVTRAHGRSTRPATADG